MGGAKETAITPPSPVADTRTDTHTQTLSDGRSSSFPLIRPARRVGITSWATTRLGFSSLFFSETPYHSRGGRCRKFCKQRGGKFFALQIVQLRLEAHSDKRNWLLRCFAVYTFVGAGRFSPPYSPGTAATAGVDCRTCVASAPPSLRLRPMSPPLPCLLSLSLSLPQSGCQAEWKRNTPAPPPSTSPSILRRANEGEKHLISLFPPLSPPNIYITHTVQQSAPR